jgi:hypothetical protein
LDWGEKSGILAKQEEDESAMAAEEEGEQPGYEEDFFLGIKINGEEFFVSRIRTALTLIMNKAPIEFNKIRKDVPVIRQGKRTRMWMHLDPPVLTVSMASAKLTSTFTAGIIAYQGCQVNASRMEDDGHRLAPSAKEQEQICINFAGKVLDKVGAPSHEVNLWKQQGMVVFDENNE